MTIVKAENNDARIPVVDLQSADAATKLIQAGIEFGFIYVKHSEDLALRPQHVDEMFGLAQEFFAAPEEVKSEHLVHNNRGFVPMLREKLDPVKHKKGDLKEAFNFAEFVDGKAQQPLPRPLNDREQQISRFAEGCHAICDVILKLVAEGLQISTADGGANWFSVRHDRTKGPTGSMLRILHYPMFPGTFAYDPIEDIRAGAHSDYGSITLLFRLPGQPGLEILTPSGNWASVPVNPEPYTESNRLPILVNIGDLLSYWTNGLLKSTVHRVIFPHAQNGLKSVQDRYSIAYFCHPSDDAELVEIPSEVVRKHRQKADDDRGSSNKVLTARDHLNQRLMATYGSA